MEGSSLARVLEGVRIVDLSRYVPGPFCSFVLAELGAEVWKIEEPRAGDPLRGLDTEAFRRLNRGKKSITVNLKSEEGRAILFRMAESADVLLEGFRPGVMDRLGVGPEPLRLRAPRLVYVALSGYGRDGPYRERAGHDLNYLAAAGALGSEPPRIQLADFAGGGLYAALAILAALFERERSGRGAFLDLALLDGVVSLLGLALSRAGELLSGRMPFYGLYGARDGRSLAVGALEPRFWERFCRALGRPDLVDRSLDPAAREEVAGVLAGRDRSEWEAVFSGIDCCVEPVLEAREALAHPQIVHRRMAEPELGLPLSRPSRTPAAAPVLGEHTAPVLEEIGFSREEVEVLRERGVC